MQKSTPAERDALALAARHGVDVGKVGKIWNDGMAVLDSIPIPDSPQALADFYTSADARKLAHPKVAAEFHARFAKAWAATADGQAALSDLDVQAIRGLADATAPADVDAVANAAALKVLENLLKHDTQDRTGLNRLNIDPRNPGNRGEAWRSRPTNTPGKPRFWNKNAPGASLDGQFDFGDFLVAAGANSMSETPPNLRPVRGKLEELRDAYSGTVPGDGGFLVPEEFRATLLELALEGSIVRPRATVIPMTALRLRIPMIDSSTNVGQVHGGMVAYWTEESAELVESAARFGSVLLEAQKLTGLSAVPNELMMDAPGFAAFVERAWPSAIRFFEDIAYLRGSGVGEPLGFLGAGNTAAIAVAEDASPDQAANTIVADNIYSMASRMLPTSFGNAVWLVAHDAMGQIFKLAADDNSPVFLTNIANGWPVTILGRPVIFTEKTVALGTRGDIALVDLGYYLIGDRMTMQMSRSEHARFTRDQTMFRIIQRTDGRPWLNTPITPANGSANTLTPFVELATRA
jgi:HK97 family phage major capsid protein